MGLFIQTTFVFVVKMPMYVCPRASWWVVLYNLEVFLLLVRTLSLEVLFV